MKQKIEQIKQFILQSMNKHFKIWVVATAVLVVGLVMIIFTPKPNIGTEQAAAEVAKLSQNIRRYYQSRPDFWGLSTAKALENGMVPEEMQQSGKIIGFWGNEVLVGRGENGEMLMPGARNFDIAYKGLSRQQCVELASFEFTEEFWLGIAGMSIVSNDQSQDFVWNDKKNTLPIRPRVAKKWCQEDNTIVWHYE